MKQTLTIYLFSLSSLFLVSCGDSFFKAIKNNEIKSVEEVKELINKGANIHYKDRGGNSLLHVVGNVEIAEFFLEKGLKVKNEDNKPLKWYQFIKRFLQKNKKSFEWQKGKYSIMTNQGRYFWIDRETHQKMFQRLLLPWPSGSSDLPHRDEPLIP